MPHVARSSIWMDLSLRLDQVDREMRSSEAGTERSCRVTLGHGDRAEQYTVTYLPNPEPSRWRSLFNRLRGHPARGYPSIVVKRMPPDPLPWTAEKPGIFDGLLQRIRDWRSDDKTRRIGNAFLESRESAIQRRLTELLFLAPAAMRAGESADDCCERVFGA